MSDLAILSAFLCHRLKNSRIFRGVFIQLFCFPGPLLRDQDKAWHVFASIYVNMTFPGKILLSNCRKHHVHINWGKRVRSESRIFPRCVSFWAMGTECAATNTQCREVTSSQVCLTDRWLWDLWGTLLTGSWMPFPWTILRFLWIPTGGCSVTKVLGTPSGSDFSSTALEDGPSSFAPVFSGARQGFSQLLGEGQPVLDTSHWDKHQDNRNARHVLFSMVKMQLIERQQSPALCQAHHFFPG